MNIDSLVTRIVKAIHSNEKIVFYLDVDFDGISCLLLYMYLRRFTDNIEIKYVERSVGHGSEHVIDQIDDDTGLYIAVDSSSNDVEPLKYLVDKGIDCLVIDHHTIQVDNPYAIIVNPQQDGCQYPNKDASGGLLVYKVCKVLDDYLGTDYADEYIDLAGFAVAADMMDMRNMENRYYYKNALTNIQHKGMKMLFKEMGKDPKNIYGLDFAFGVSPAITAATRADNIKLAIDFLLCDDEMKLKKFVKELVKLNEERKVKQAEAIERLTPHINPEDKAIILYDPTLGKGLNGLVAQDISRKHNRPVIVLGDGDSENTYSGSFRGLEDEFSMMDLLQECEYAHYGVGHSAAGGTSLNKEDIDNLRHELNDKLVKWEPDNSLYYDLEIDSRDVTEDLINDIQEFYRVSGRNFTPGKFRITNLFVEDKKLMGKLNNTVKIDCDNIQAMKFKTDEEYYNSVPVFCSIEAIGTLNINTWIQYKPRYKVNKYLQLFIDDYVLSN